MSISRRPSWQKAKKRGHRARREAKRPHVPVPHGPRLSLMLWAINGEPVTSFHVVRTEKAGHLSHVDYAGVRYDLVGSPDLRNGIAHYQTATIVHRGLS